MENFTFCAVGYIFQRTKILDPIWKILSLLYNIAYNEVHYVNNFDNYD